MWKLEYTSAAERFIKTLDDKTKGKCKSVLEHLMTKPDLGKQLVGPLKGLRSLRFGKYRIIYKKEISRLIIIVITIGFRKDIYKK